MNRPIPKIGAVIVTIAVFLFAVCMIVDFPFGSYFVCMFLSLGYIMMMVHGILFIGCFIMPMTGVFTSMASGDARNA